MTQKVTKKDLELQLQNNKERQEQKLEQILLAKESQIVTLEEQLDVLKEKQNEILQQLADFESTNQNNEESSEKNDLSL